MKCLECKDFVKIEVIPVITHCIARWIDTERYEDWFENIEDVEEFSEMELPDSLRKNIVSEIKQVVKECVGDYDYDVPTFDEEDLTIMIENIWDKEKMNYTDKLYDMFDRETFNEFDDDENYEGNDYDF